jgi:hypothetical protein
MRPANHPKRRSLEIGLILRLEQIQGLMRQLERQGAFELKHLPERHGNQTVRQQHILTDDTGAFAGFLHQRQPLFKAQMPGGLPSLEHLFNAGAFQLEIDGCTCRLGHCFSLAGQGTSRHSSLICFPAQTHKSSNCSCHPHPRPFLPLNQHLLGFKTHLTGETASGFGRFSRKREKGV